MNVCDHLYHQKTPGVYILDHSSLASFCCLHVSKSTQNVFCVYLEIKNVSADDVLLQQMCRPLFCFVSFVG